MMSKKAKRIYVVQDEVVCQSEPCYEGESLAEAEEAYLGAYRGKAGGSQPGASRRKRGQIVMRTYVFTDPEEYERAKKDIGDAPRLADEVVVRKIDY